MLTLDERELAPASMEKTERENAFWVHVLPVVAERLGETVVVRLEEELMLLSAKHRSQRIQELLDGELPIIAETHSEGNEVDGTLDGEFITELEADVEQPISPAYKRRYRALSATEK